jgi:hypothetical protein
MQKPVSDTPMDAAAVATTNSTQRGLTSAAIVVAQRRTTPAMSQTVRSMYHRWVATM